MTKERQVEILMKDGCPRYDAERHLKMAVSFIRTLKRVFTNT